MTAVLIFLAIWIWSPRHVFSGLLAMILVLLFAQGLKSMFDMNRPAAVLDDVHVVGRTLRHRSFPSGHSATIMALGVVLSDYFKMRKYRIMLVAVCSVIAITRVSIGAHFPLDVWVGALLGWIAGDLALLPRPLFLRWQSRIPAQRGTVIAGLVLMATAVAAVITFPVDRHMAFFQVFGGLSILFSVYMIYSSNLRTAGNEIR